MRARRRARTAAGGPLPYTAPLLLLLSSFVCVSQYTIRAADAACTANSLDIVLCLDVSTSIVDNVLRKDSAQT